MIPYSPFWSCSFLTLPEVSEEEEAVLRNYRIKTDIHQQTWRQHGVLLSHNGLSALISVKMKVWAVLLLNPASGPKCCPDDRVMALDKKYLVHLRIDTGEIQWVAYSLTNSIQVYQQSNSPLQLCPQMLWLSSVSLGSEQVGGQNCGKLYPQEG